MRWLLAVLLLGACGDFKSPAELTKPTVLAVIADPPLVPPGGTTDLSVVLAGPDGPMQADATTWTLVDTLPDVPPFGSVTAGDPGEASYVAPDPVPTQPDGAPPLVSVSVHVVAGDTAVDVVKALLVVDVPSANPVVSSFTIDGDDATDGMQLDSGTSYDLEVDTDPAADPEKAAYAWYSTVGTIDYYHSDPTQLVAGDPGDGWLFAVVRDGQGGVAWRGVQLTVR